MSGCLILGWWFGHHHFPHQYSFVWTWLPINATTRPSLRDCVSSCVVTYVDASVENSRCYCHHLTHCCLMCTIKKREGSYSAAIRVKYRRTGGWNKRRNELEESIRWSICEIKPDLTTGFKGFKAAERNMVHVLHPCALFWWLVVFWSTSQSPKDLLLCLSDCPSWPTNLASAALWWMV